MLLDEIYVFAEDLLYCCLLIADVLTDFPDRFGDVAERFFFRLSVDKVGHCWTPTCPRLRNKFYGKRVVRGVEEEVVG